MACLRPARERWCCAAALRPPRLGPGNPGMLLIYQSYTLMGPHEHYKMHGDNNCMAGCRKHDTWRGEHLPTRSPGMSM